MASETKIREDVLYRSVLPTHLLDPLVQLTERQNCSLPELVEDAVKQYVKRHCIKTQGSRRKSSHPTRK